MRRVLFLDRGGTLVVEPKGGSMDALDNLRLVAGVMPALLRFKAAGYQFVIVTNQGGLGGSNFPRATFERADEYLLAQFASHTRKLSGGR